MKFSKNTILLVATIFCMVILQSCGSSEAKVEDKQLSSFMLGGIYFIHGYGGINEVTGMMNGAGYTEDEQLVSGYKEIFEFPFEISEGSGARRMLQSAWDISNKKELLESLENLKTRDHAYKAWDYARIVNNACMGYSAGYLSKDEVTNITLEILPLAQGKFSNWEDYYADFNKGRVDWNPEDGDKTSYESIAKEITSYENSIYKILPLNPSN